MEKESEMLIGSPSPGMLLHTLSTVWRYASPRQQRGVKITATDSTGAGRMQLGGSRRFTVSCSLLAAGGWIELHHDAFEAPFSKVVF